MDVLVRIMRVVVRGAVRFAEKARLELEADALGTRRCFGGNSVRP